MSHTLMLRKVIESFENFVKDSPLETLPPATHGCLLDYIQSWIESGTGVRACLGDFQVFQAAVIVITAYWQQTESFLDFSPEEPGEDPDKSRRIRRQVDYVLIEVFPPRHQILDPYWFAEQTFHALHGNMEN